MQGMGRSARVGVAMLAWLVVEATAWGNVSFDTVTWGSGNDTLGWMNTDGQAVSVTAPTSGGNLGGYLSETFAPTQPPVPQTDHLVNTGAGYVGDFVNAGVAGVNFDFMGQPLGLQYVYFQGGGSTWEQLLTVNSSSWQSYNVSFTSPGQWTETAGAESFAQALADVTLVGFETTYQDTGVPFSYGVDNWQYQQSGPTGSEVPEPETLSMGLVLLVSVWVMFRSRIGRSLKCLLSQAGKA